MSLLKEAEAIKARGLDIKENGMIIAYSPNVMELTRRIRC